MAQGIGEVSQRRQAAPRIEPSDPWQEGEVNPPQQQDGPKKGHEGAEENEQRLVGVAYGPSYPPTQPRNDQRARSDQEFVEVTLRQNDYTIFLRYPNFSLEWSR